MKEKTLIEKVTDEVTNIYRTDEFIVYQCVHVVYGDNGNTLMSDDVYYRRTPDRDEAYDKVFGDECPLFPHKRMKVAGYTRKYVD